MREEEEEEEDADAAAKCRRKEILPLSPSLSLSLLSNWLFWWVYYATGGSRTGWVGGEEEADRWGGR